MQSLNLLWKVNLAFFLFYIIEIVLPTYFDIYILKSHCYFNLQIIIDQLNKNNKCPDILTKEYSILKSDDLS